MNHTEEFEAQLARDDERVLYELLHNPEKAVIRDFYNTWFDEISVLIADCRSFRTAIEDICNLEPEMRSILMEDHLFVYMVNVAIKNGVLRKDSFEDE